MAKVRAARRAEREAAHRKLMAKRERQQTRRNGRRELWRKLTIHDWRQRNRGRLYHPQARERAVVILLGGILMLPIWMLVRDPAWSLALTLVTMLSIPIVLTVVFGKRSG